jgi:SHS2 domain-containing protein
MRMKKYEQIDISGDAGLKIWGKTLEDLFQNAAYGTWELITDPSGVREKEKREITLSSNSYEGLLVLWLNELIFLFDSYGFIGTSFSVILEGFSLKACVTGGIINPDINESRLLLKAATYHDLSLKKVRAIWEATVIFDI